MRSIFQIIFIVIAIGLFFVEVNPLYSDVSKLKNNVAIYNAALENSTQLQKTRDTLLASYNAISQDQRTRIEDMTPNTVDNIQLILQIQQIASGHGMGLTNITFDAPSSGSGATDANGNPIINKSDPSQNKTYGIFNLEFKTQGTYDTFVAFLHDMEQNLRIVDVKSIHFSVPQVVKSSTGQVNPNAPDPNVYEYDIKIQTYWLKS